MLSLLFASLFHFGKVRFEPVDALAYQQDSVTIVALTSYKIDRDGVLAAIDPVNALYAQAGERGSFVLVRVLAPDRCSVSGFLAETQQQLDLGSFTGQSKVSPATVTGNCATDKPQKMFDDEYDFNLSYDVPITAIPKPTALPAGGGEPGAQYVQLLKAIAAADWDVAHLHTADGELPDTKKKVSESNYFQNLALNYPKPSSTVTGGLMKGDRAQLDIKGTNHDGRNVTGVVAMKKVGSDWRVVDQQFFGTE